MELEPQTPSPPPPPPGRPPSASLLSTVDTSRPFSSVKEAVAVFGQKLLAQEIIHHSSSLKYQNSPIRKFSPKTNPTEKNNREEQNTLVRTLKKLEAELEETKTGLKLLKERAEETEVAVASLNAELHKNMSKIAREKASVAGKAAVVARTESLRERERKMEEKLPTLAQILGSGDGKGLFRERTKERKVVVKKKKPIVPLVWDLFPKEIRVIQYC